MIVCTRLQGRLLPARRIRLAVKVNPTSENYRFGLDVRAGGDGTRLHLTERMNQMVSL